MTAKAGYRMRRLAVLAITTTLLSVCATGGSEPRIATVCPPVAEYSREFQTRAANELTSLPHGSVIGEMLSDYAVICDQARACELRSSIFKSAQSPRRVYDDEKEPAPPSCGAIQSVRSS